MVAWWDRWNTLRTIGVSALLLAIFALAAPETWIECTGRGGPPEVAGVELGLRPGVELTPHSLRRSWPSARRHLPAPRRGELFLTLPGLQTATCRSRRRSAGAASR